MRFAPLAAGRQTPLPSPIVTAAGVICKRALNQCASAARAGSRRAAEAMVAGQNVAIFDLFRIDVPEVKPRCFTVAPWHLQHLVEVAVENLARPADADGVTAHQSFHGGGIEVVNQ